MSGVTHPSIFIFPPAGSSPAFTPPYKLNRGSELEKLPLSPGAPPKLKSLKISG
jgi:hypothetical protein